MNSEALLILAGNLGSWFYQSVAGIELDPSVPGWRRAFLRPRCAGALQAASGSIETVAGRYASTWRCDDGRMDWTVSVPPNATATAWLPTDRPGDATESGLPVVDAPGVRVLRSEKGALVLELAGGEYHFEAFLPASAAGG